jgi:hypothetical protein
MAHHQGNDLNRSFVFLDRTPSSWSRLLMSLCLKWRLCLREQRTRLNFLARHQPLRLPAALRSPSTAARGALRTRSSTPSSRTTPCCPSMRRVGGFCNSLFSGTSRPHRRLQLRRLRFQLLPPLLYFILMSRKALRCSTEQERTAEAGAGAGRPSTTTWRSTWWPSAVQRHVTGDTVYSSSTLSSHSSGISNNEAAAAVAVEVSDLKPPSAAAVAAEDHHHHYHPHMMELERHMVDHHQQLFRALVLTTIPSSRTPTSCAAAAPRGCTRRVMTETGAMGVEQAG